MQMQQLRPIVHASPFTTALPLAERLLHQAEGVIEKDPVLARQYIRQISALLGSQDEATAAVQEETSSDPAGVSTKSQFARGGLASWQLRVTKDHIQRHLADSILIRDLAALTRLSASHFCRAFKATTGETPHRHIIRCRLERAQTLMLTTEENLSQVACACGFTDHAHLTRLFRQHFGATPFLWRQASK
ncbi:helix-turn-helix transcriptional regulator [Novosphingobium lindaniclasticum]|uniref:HTH araC/xylS-type domain-containing protein n=1 Tax=Novosphingobium lindaniclasticum LE124 TaxID=1096930 RepID=T0JAK4_9SPHN|nr:helix-turn-helix domain-containing protein [Novosphingobium lindaniclasticum]EQB18929.1 hypothetical protein L284_03455 [Novosphingobium lindaniclasticum LE124]